ncbi:MAG TPA: arginyltransferase [Gemmataceae bacterium]|nr:arginyltransferase [Gemmataceae bacterium]
MESFCRFLAPPSPCGYLPEQAWRLEYEMVASATPAEYMQRMLQGWRRFGDTLFRPHCPACSACRSLRVLVDRFRPDRSQRRCRKANEGAVELRVGRPGVSRAKLRLYDRYHEFQAESKGWPQHPAKDPASYARSFVENPFPTQEWCYYLGGRLIAVGYVDDLPGGLSAIYFFYDPDERARSPGTWNVLELIEVARARRLPHVYLGYYVAGCRSMAYKTRFVPNQVLDADGQWRDFWT